MIYCDDIVTDHCTLRSGGIWNGDGWDPDSSTNCTLFATEFETEDDSVAIKSGKNPEGNAINRPTKHICVFDCHSNGGHGICIGSEMSGGVADVQIWDCDIAASSNGMADMGAMSLYATAPSPACSFILFHTMMTAFLLQSNLILKISTLNGCI